MKPRKPFKQNFQKGVAYETSSAGHSEPTPTTPFDELTVQLNLWNIDWSEIEEAGAPERVRELLLASRVTPMEIDEFLAELQNRRTATIGKSALIASASTKPNDAARGDTTGPGSRWTLPEAVERARRKVSNYLPHDANDLGWWALGLGKLFANGTRQLTELEMEQLKDKSPLETLALLTPQGRCFAEAIVGSIRINPQSLLGPNSERLVAALVDLLEAAHFGICANRFPGLLPTGNRKRAASEARKALRLLASGSQGNPPDYPVELLASAVGFIQVAFAPIKKAWGTSNLEAIRENFGDEIKDFTDKELLTLLTDTLLTAAARLAEKATGLSAESFETAWRKKPSVRTVFQEYLP